MAIRKSIWFYPEAAPTITAYIASNASNTSSTTTTLDYLVHTNTNVTTAGNAYKYVDMSSVTNYVIQAGDFLEYDIYWESNLAYVGIDLIATDNTFLRGTSTAIDQNGLNAHPATDITTYAYQKWYHRKIPLTNFSSGTDVSAVGKTISVFALVGESDTLSTAMTAYIKNICITDGKGNNVYNTQNFAGMF